MMATITAVPTTTITDEWPTKVPAVDPHLNIDEGVDTPDTGDYVQAQAIDKTNTYGGFDFSAIPHGSTINSIRVRQYGYADDDAFVPGVRFALLVDGEERTALMFNVNSSGADVTTFAEFAAPPITRWELAEGLLSVSKKTFAVLDEPAIETE